MFARLLPFIVALAFAPSALAGGPTMQFGAAEDVVRAPDLPAAKAKMTLLRLAGFSSVRVTSQWQGTEAAPSETELTEPAERRGRRAALCRPGLPLDLSDGLARDAADARGARAVRRLRHGPEAAAAVDQGRDHRERAEHQPLLAAPVQPERHRRRRTCVPRAARALLRRGQAASTRRRASGAARSPRAASTGRAPGATRTRRWRSSRTWASPTGRAGGRSRSWTGSPSTRTPTPRASRRIRPTPTRRRSGSPTTTA